MKHKIRIITLLGCIFEPKQCFLRSYGKFNGIPAISYTFGCISIIVISKRFQMLLHPLT